MKSPFAVVTTILAVVAVATFGVYFWIIAVDHVASTSNTVAPADDLVLAPREACETDQINRMADKHRREFKIITDWDVENFQLAAQRLCLSWEQSLPKLVRLQPAERP